jgi:acid stress-induced BolA-like protein IbaG/YrbA
LFKAKPIIEKHQEVHKCLRELLSPGSGDGVHALTITAKSPEEWEKNNSVLSSPGCMNRVTVKK